VNEKGRSGKREEGEEKVVGKVYAIDGDEDGEGKSWRKVEVVLWS